MPTFTETLPPTSPFWEACARHTNRQTSRLLQYLYLCDPCARRLTEEALNDRPPIYHGETVMGYCGLCNKRLEVTLRQWFACGPCWNVIIAYQKTIVASQAVLDFWRRCVQPQYPDLHCDETEVVYFSPYARAAKTKRQLAGELRTLDFLVSEMPAGRPLFHIELKTGPGSIEEMNEFQLDVNDYDDIVGAVKNTRLPAYVFHAQVVHSYEPPTRYSVPRGIWYSDVWTLKTNRKDTRQRRGEDKQAGYYRTEAFRPIQDFTQEIATKRYVELSREIDLLD
jgi:hypothetical protein